MRGRRTTGLAALIAAVALPLAAEAGTAPPAGGSAPDPGKVAPWVKQVPGSPTGTTTQGSNVPRDAPTRPTGRLADPCARPPGASGTTAPAGCPDATPR